MTTPKPRRHRAVEADRFDQMEYREILDQADALREMDIDLNEQHHYTSDLLADVWTAAYKTAPRLRERADMDPSRLVNYQVIVSLLDTPEFTDLHTETAGDPYAAALAVISQRDRLLRLLGQAEQTQHAADRAAEAEQNAADAGQQVAAALEAAAARADTDGNVAQDVADAVQIAIGNAQDAETAAAAAVQAAQEALFQISPQIRTAVRAAAANAAQQVRAEAALMAAWAVAPGQLQRMDYATRQTLAHRLTSGRIGRFADLIGRFRTMAAGERTRRVQHAPGELVGVTLGDDVGRLIPSELAALGVPALRAPFAARLAEQRLMVYQTRGEDKTGKGAIIACVDCSGSMERAGRDGHTREAWAKACALALLDQARNARPRRDFSCILFSSQWEVQVYRFPAAQPVHIGDVADLAECFFGGGTDYQAPLTSAADLLAAEHAAAGRIHGDIVFITDGQADLDEDWMRTWQDHKTSLDFRVFGISVGRSPSPALRTLADGLHTIEDLTDPGTVREIFHTI